MIQFEHLSQQLRKDILKMIYAAGVGNISKCYSILDILLFLYFGEVIQSNPEDKKSENRDFLVLSARDYSPALYVILGEIGFFSKDEYFLYSQVDGALSKYARPHIPGVEVASGYSGQGLLTSLGIAYGLKIQGKSQKVFCIMDEEEFEQEDVIEAMKRANMLQLDNIFFLVNNLSHSTKVEEIAQSCTWDTKTIQNGHNFEVLKDELKDNINNEKGPMLFSIHTTLGKGVSLLENEKINDEISLSDDFYNTAVGELEPTETTQLEDY